MSIKDKSIELLHSWVSSESLRKHCLSVACAMEGYARKNNLSDEDAEKWFIAGLLHDFDYEKYPLLEKHPKMGCEELERLGYDKEIIEAIMGHGNHTGVARKSMMAKCLFAVDALCG